MISHSIPTPRSRLTHGRRFASRHVLLAHDPAAVQSMSQHESIATITDVSKLARLGIASRGGESVRNRLGGMDVAWVRGKFDQG